MKIRTQVFLRLFFGVILQGWFFVHTLSAAATTKEPEKSTSAAPAAKSSFLSSLMSKLSPKPASPPDATPTSTTTTSTLADKAKAAGSLALMLGAQKLLTPKDPNAPKEPTMMEKLKMAAAAAKQTVSTTITTTIAAAKDTANAAVAQAVGAAKDVAANTQQQLQQGAANIAQQAQGAATGLTAGLPVDGAIPSGPGLMNGLKEKIDGAKASIADAQTSLVGAVKVDGSTTTPSLSLGGLTDKLKGATSSLIGSGKTSEAAAGKMAQLELLFKKGRDTKLSPDAKQANLDLIKDLMAKQSANELSAADMTKLQGFLYRAKNAGLAPTSDLEDAIEKTKKNVAAFKAASADEHASDDRHDAKGKSGGKKSDARHTDRDDRGGKGRNAHGSKGHGSHGRDRDDDDRDRGGRHHQASRGDRGGHNRDDHGGSRRRNRPRRGERRRQRRKGKAMRSGASRKALLEKIRNIREGRSQGRRRGALPNTHASFAVIQQQKSKILQQKKVIDQLKHLKAKASTVVGAKRPAHSDDISHKDESSVKDQAAVTHDADTERRKANVGKRSGDAADGKAKDAESSRRADTVKKRSSDAATSGAPVSDADRRKATVTARSAEPK